MRRLMAAHSFALQVEALASRLPVWMTTLCVCLCDVHNRCSASWQFAISRGRADRLLAGWCRSATPCRRDASAL